MKIEKATKILSDNHIKHGGTVRCGICGNVSNENIETNINTQSDGVISENITETVSNKSNLHNCEYDGWYSDSSIC